LQASTSGLRMRALSDDETSATTLSTSNSDGITFSVPTTVPVPTTTGEALRWGSDAEVAALTATGQINTFANAFDPRIVITDTGETDKSFRLYSTNGVMRIQRIDDDYANAVNAMIIDLADGAVDMTQAPAVTVPAPTTTGEALRWGSDAEVAALTATSNIEAASAAPKLTLNETDQAADAAAWKMQASAGTFKISSASDAGAQQTSFINISRSAGSLDMTGATSVSVPAVADGATEAAAQVTARDSGTGQLAIAGIELGDTGWRDVTSLLTNGFVMASGSFLIRRVGNTVMYGTDVLGSYLDGSSKTANGCITLPSGFSAAGAASYTAWRTANTSFTAAWHSGAAISVNNTSTTLSPSGQFFTDASWPSTLPGTAA